MPVDRINEHQYILPPFQPERSSETGKFHTKRRWRRNGWRRAVDVTSVLTRWTH